MVNGFQLQIGLPFTAGVLGLKTLREVDLVAVTRAQIRLHTSKFILIVGIAHIGAPRRCESKVSYFAWLYRLLLV
ncbi:Uncharacterised protein [Vibrio cholerae]|uniref:Uncharacterized protein n=1 Tax=Vibrio cholerae TaxID=666 RepID=A0A655WK14_VIBCL|nr:Uncharacterised protein [Vibrio cholerae]